MSASGEFAVATEKPSAARAAAYPLAAMAFLILLCLAYSINAADRQIFPTLLPAIRQALGYDLKVAGLLSTIFTLGLALAGLPTGYVVDRISRKTVILVAMVIYSVFTLATIYASRVLGHAVLPRHDGGRRRHANGRAVRRHRQLFPPQTVVLHRLADRRLRGRGLSRVPASAPCSPRRPTVGKRRSYGLPSLDW